MKIPQHGLITNYPLLTSANFNFRAFPRESGRDNERRQFNSPKFEFKIIKTLPKWASLGISKHARLCFVSSAEKVAKEWSGPFSPITQKV